MEELPVVLSSTVKNPKAVNSLMILEAEKDENT
jgi:hypothetical protein